MHAEATARGYRFDPGEFDAAAQSARIRVTKGQCDYEWQHLLAKLAVRNPQVLARWHDTSAHEWHPLFEVVPGAVEDWEKR